MSLTTTSRNEVLIMAPTIVSLTDIESLADRLISRSKSRLLNDQPAMQSDLHLAAKLLIRWCRRGTEQLECPFDLDDD
jgi:hypothetical protein